MRACLWMMLAGTVWLCGPCLPSAARADVPRAERIRNEARAILASPDFRDRSLRIPILEKAAAVIRRALRAIGDWLDRLFRAGRNAGRATDALLWAIFTALVVLMALILAAGISRLSVAVGRRRSQSNGSDAAFLTRPQDPDAWLSQAHSALASGDLREAFRAVFLAILLQMDRAGAIRYREPATNGEYLAALRKHPDLYSVVRPVAMEFDAHWYGFRPVSRLQVERALAAFGKVQKLTDPFTGGRPAAEGLYSL
ncbi:MAG: DUF4129 domain-containing protein [Chthonomonadales bacterium]